MSVTNHTVPSDISVALRTEIERRVTAGLGEPEFFQTTVEAVVDRVRYPHAARFWQEIERREVDEAAEDRAAEQGTTDDDAHEYAAGGAPDNGSTPEREHGGRTRRGSRGGRRRDRRQVED